jgi:hypothetical protein
VRMMQLRQRYRSKQSFHVSKWGGLTNVRYSVEARAAIGNLAVTELNFNPTARLRLSCRSTQSSRIRTLSSSN